MKKKENCLSLSSIRNHDSAFSSKIMKLGKLSKSKV